MSIKNNHSPSYPNLSFLCGTMSMLIHYTECPLCTSADILPSLTAKDYTVSNEVFDIWHCNNCMARFTQNIPGKEDIGKYYQSTKYISHTETKQGLINKLYHLVRKYTLIQKKKLIEKETNLHAGTLLDVGAGSGAFAATMQKAGWTVTGLEPDASARQNAKNNHDMELQEPDNLFALPPEGFDAITLWHVLEHVHELHKYLDTFYTILKPGGKLIIAVPNYTGKDAKTYQHCWAAYDVPRHLYHFSPESMHQLMHRHHLIIKKYKPMWFDSFYVSMLSEQYKSGKKNLVKAVWIGLLSNIKALSNVQQCSSVIYIVEKN